MERIILLAPRLELRGSTVYTLVLAKELKLRGYRVTVMAAEGTFAEELASEKIAFLRADLTGNFFRDLLYLRKYAREMRAFNPELIHITHHELAPLGGLLARSLDVPYILTLQNPVKHTVYCHHRHLRGVIAVSQPIRQSAVNVGRIPREKVHIIENGVASSLNPPERNSAGLIPVVGTVSRLQKDRGIKYFIHAARELIRREVQAHFLVIGTGPDETKIRKLVRKLDISEHVTINMAATDYRNLTNPIDIFVCPALTEGFGIFVLQAMAAAVPVVASAAGGVFSIIKDHETGLIVPKKDTSIFADKIQAYLDDREFATRIGVNGFNYVQENFPFKKTLEGTLNLYEEGEDALTE
jgi:glycosyltransferase involved in cell wall biosynthesis